METITVDGLTVLRQLPQVATQPAILFIHGFFVDGSVFEPMMRFFADAGYPCHAVNLRGRAGSRMDRPLGTASIEDYADDAEAVARTLDNPIIIGHSMGGLIAQVLAARGVGRALVLFSPAPPRGIRLLTPALAVVQLRYLPSIIGSRPVVPGRRDLGAFAMNRVPPALREQLLDATVPDSGRAGRQMSMLGVAVDPAQVRVPVLVCSGNRDRFIPFSRGTRIAKRYGAAMIEAPGRGHMLIIEPGWEDLARQVRDWLETSLAR